MCYFTTFTVTNCMFPVILLNTVIFFKTILSPSSPLFTVDDGTGVINCLCWKNDPMKEELDSGKCETVFIMCYHDNKSKQQTN